MKTIYALYNKNCGHIASISNDRATAERLIGALTVAGKWGWRIKTDPSDAELESALRGERCEACTLDGSAPDGSILLVDKPGSAP